MQLKKNFIEEFAPWAASRLIRFCCGTARLQEYPHPFYQAHGKNGQPFILVFWHSRIFFASWYFSFYRCYALISRHSDGELVAAAVEKLGIRSARGSTTRGGGAALRELVRMIKKGFNAGITPDGPTGPARKLQDGVISLGQLSQRPIIPISFSSRHAVRLKSWDRFMVPVPFSKAAFVYGEPIMIPRKLDDDARKRYRVRIEKELDRVTDLSDELTGQPRI